MVRDKVLGAFLGMSVGSTLAWTSMYHQSRLLPSWTRRLRREIELQAEEEGILSLGLPFALNQPADAFTPAPSAHVEWALFQAEILAESDGVYRLEKALESWKRLVSGRTEMRLYFSQRAALENIANGKLPPASGNDNPHYFDDTACFRAIPTGCCYPGRSREAAAAAGADATISNAEDGVWAAQALAAAVSVVCADSSNDDSTPALAVKAALAYLPDTSWIGRMARMALKQAAEARSSLDLAFRLQHEILNTVYNYGNSAAETVPICLAILSFHQGALEESLLTALSLARSADSVPALVGGLCGAFAGMQAVPEMYHKQLQNARGVAIPVLAGVDILEKAERLAEIIEERTHQTRKD